MSAYRVRFRAISGETLGSDARERLSAALASMPGVDDVDSTSTGDDGSVSATFWIEVRLGMADAARDGSRLAREALKVAGMQVAQLIELSVTIPDHVSLDGPRARGRGSRDGRLSTLVGLGWADGRGDSPAGGDGHFTR